MDCEKVRDQFSSLLEKELTPSEEKIIREHLSSCPQCQKELEQFEKTMQWLHSVGEVEVPDGFLHELHKKMEERKSKAIPAEKIRGKGFHFPLSLKLPAQAAAMVAIVFLVLYLTKMMPVETYRLKEAREKPFFPSVKEKAEQVVVPKEMEKEKRAMETPPETLRFKEVDSAKASAQGEGKMEGKWVAPLKEETKKVETPPQQTGIKPYPSSEVKDAGAARVSPKEPEQIEKGWVVKEKSVMASKPPQEIILRTSDREKVVSQIHELVKQRGGEIVRVEDHMLLASLPNRSVSEFEKELEGLSASIKTEKPLVPKRSVEGVGAKPGVKREELDEGSRKPARGITDEGRTVFRILLIQE